MVLPFAAFYSIEYSTLVWEEETGLSRKSARSGSYISQPNCIYQVINIDYCH